MEGKTVDVGFFTEIRGDNFRTDDISAIMGVKQQNDSKFLVRIVLNSGVAFSYEYMDKEKAEEEYQRIYTNWEIVNMIKFQGLVNPNYFNEHKGLKLVNPNGFPPKNIR